MAGYFGGKGLALFTFLVMLRGAEHTWLQLPCNISDSQTDEPVIYSPWKPDVLCNGIVANCSSRNISQIPPPQDIPAGVASLILNKNSIQQIPSNSLARYNALICLDLSYNGLDTIEKDSFFNLTKLQYLNLKHNKLLFAESLSKPPKVNPLFLAPLTSLKSLDLTRNYQHQLDDLISILGSVREYNLTFLKLTHIMNAYAPCVMVSSSFAESLPRSLQRLLISANSISFLHTDVMSSLPERLTHLDFSDNRLTFGEYLLNLTRLTNLIELRLTGGQVSFDLPTAFPNAQSGDCSYSARTSTVSQSINFTFPLPPVLDVLNISYAGLSYSITKFHFDENLLTLLALNGNNLPVLKGPVKGLTHLKHLDLSNCNIKYISETFFDEFPSLEKLNLSINLFGSGALAQNYSLFSRLNKLKRLDLSTVNIIFILEHAFKGLDSLEELLLQHNTFYYFEANISHMLHLKFINFSYTEISSLNQNTRSEIDAIVNRRKVTMSLDFSQANIHCNCENIHFLHWLTMANITLYNAQANKCILTDNSEEHNVTDFKTKYHVLAKECVSKIVLLLSISAATVLVLVAIVSSIVYRFRWKLKYLYYSAYISVTRKSHQEELNQQFEYDVFVSYVSDDHDFVMKTLYPKLQSLGLRVHVHCLHFVSGQFIASNIVQAIQSSRRTLVVLTRQLLTSVWCHFEIQMATMEHVHTGRQVLLFLLMEDLSQKELGTELLYHIQSSTYIRFPELLQSGPSDAAIEQQMDAFWAKLAADIQS